MIAGLPRLGATLPQSLGAALSRYKQVARGSAASRDKS
jgi:hypothetical protein